MGVKIVVVVIMKMARSELVVPSKSSRSGVLAASVIIHVIYRQRLLITSLDNVSHHRVAHPTELRRAFY
jgi:hypothetical protein